MGPGLAQFLRGSRGSGPLGPLSVRACPRGARSGLGLGRVGRPLMTWAEAEQQGRDILWLLCPPCPLPAMWLVPRDLRTSIPALSLAHSPPCFPERHTVGEKRGSWVSPPLPLRPLFTAVGLAGTAVRKPGPSAVHARRHCGGWEKGLGFTPWSSHVPAVWPWASVASGSWQLDVKVNPQSSRELRARSSCAWNKGLRSSRASSFLDQ